MSGPEPFDSGPGRKWLFFLFGAGTFAFLALRGAAAGDAWPLLAARLLGVTAFGATTWRAHGLGVRADETGLVVRTWSGNRRWSWGEVADIAGEPRAPEIVLRDGARHPLLDSWHPDAESVGAEVRRRLLASR